MAAEGSGVRVHAEGASPGSAARMPTTLQETPPARPLDRAVDGTAGRLAATGFAALSALRRRRVFHPYGAAFAATIDVHGGDVGAALLDRPGRRHAVVRLSRGIGTPEPFPDIFGLALRFVDAHGPDAHQDLLLASSAAPPGLRSTILPGRGYADVFYSSVLRLGVGPRRLLVGARALRVAGTAALPRLDDVAAELASARLTFELLVAEATGPWQPVAEVQIGRRLTDAESESLRFNPFHTGGGIEAVGAGNALRRRSYSASQAARPRPLDLAG